MESSYVLIVGVGVLCYALGRLHERVIDRHFAANTLEAIGYATQQINGASKNQRCCQSRSGGPPAIGFQCGGDDESN